MNRVEIATVDQFHYELFGFMEHMAKNPATI